jgi:hypothetical protein
MRETYGSHFRDGGMIRFAELLRDAQGGFTVLPQEGQEIPPRNEIRLGRFNYVRG